MALLAKLLAPPPADDASAAARDSGNAAFSPLSVHAALALVAAGARGATLEQLLAFLGAPSAAELADFGRRVADRVLADRSDSGGPRFLFGGGVWVDASRGGLTDAFRDVAAESYKSEARTVSFAKEADEVVKMINEWVKKAMNNLIDTIVSPSDINAATDLVLANAVYFKGAWLHQFQPSNTKRGSFHLLDGRRVEATFMSKLATRHAACMDGFKVVKLPYTPGRAALRAPARDDADTRYSMFVFLPEARGGIAAMVDEVAAAPASLYGILAGMEERPVSLTLPKFDISFEWTDLENDLRRLGLSLPFSPTEADLRGMCKGDDVAGGDDGGSRRPTFLSKVAHKAVVKVNEAGTEAAAVTMCMRGGGGPPPDLVEFVADHPFTFFIMEEGSGVIVFAGHVVDPTK